MASNTSLSSYLPLLLLSLIEKLCMTDFFVQKIKLIRGIKPADAFVAFKEYTQQVAGSSSRVSKHPRFSNALEILSVNGNEFTEEFASLSEELVWLRWEGFPLQNLPSWLILKKLSVLELHAADNLEELWQDNACVSILLSSFKKITSSSCFSELN